MKTRPNKNGKYLFSKNINNSNNSGIIDVTTNSLFCWCSEDQSQIILDAITTIQECDLMPSELLKQRDELFAMVKRLKSIFEGEILEFNIPELNELIKQIEQ